MKFEGSFCALVTPFDKAGRFDESAFGRLVRRQIAGGTSGLVVCGSTGEAATLTNEEYARAIAISVLEARGRVPVVAGVSGNATWRVVEAAARAESFDADALLVVSPHYNKPTQDGLYAHFLAVAKATTLPVMIYNIPSRTAVNVAPTTIARLARAARNIVAVKESAGSVDQASEILALAPRGFVLLAGDDTLAVPMMAVGARGVVSVVANVLPKQTQRLCDLFLGGRVAQAAALHQKMFPLIKSLFVETNPIPVKAALATMGLCQPTLRLPLTTLSRRHWPALRRELKKFR